MMSKKRKASNGRVCFIIPGNLFSTPYLQRYLNLLQKPYDLIFWNCRGIEERIQATKQFVFNFEMGSGASKLKKAVGYIKFKLLAEKVIRRENYDAVLTLTGNTAVLLSGILSRRYDRRYLVDIRDYYKENSKWYYALEKRAVEHSGTTVISSEGYRSFLPEHDYVIAHNISYLTEAAINSARNSTGSSKEKLVLSYIGNMRFPEQDKRLLSFFANDERFHINLFGNGYGQLSGYCKEQGINNVTITDWFPPEETIGYYLQTDIVLNLYGNNSPMLDYALSNKLYYAAQLGKPILVCPGTYMETVSKQYGFGFTLDLNDEASKDALLQYYNTIEWDRFFENCDLFLEKVAKEDAAFEAAVSRFLSNGRESNRVVVSLSGIDSAGKSTQIALLKRYCDEHGITNGAKWSKARATPCVEFIKRLVRRDKKMTHEEKLHNREEIFASSKKKKLLLFASLFELCFYWGVYFRILKTRYKCLILDRYLWDSYAEIRTDFYGIDFQKWLLWKLLVRIALKPDSSILLTVPLEVSLSRDIEKTDMTVDNPALIDSIERKTEKINTYYELMNESRWGCVIDGTKSIDDVHKEILSVLRFEG